MLHELSNIPHPTATEVLVSLEVFLALYVPKRVLDVIVDREYREIRQKRSHHKKSHDSVARFCAEDDCIPVSTPRSSQQSPPEPLLPELSLGQERQ